MENDLVNIGAGREYSIREFAATICRLIGYPAEEISYDPTRYVGAKNKCLGSKNSNRFCPTWNSRHWKRDCERTIDWFIDNRQSFSRPRPEGCRMIITMTPLRVSFLGGGTDYPEHFRQHGGATLAHRSTNIPTSPSRAYRIFRLPHPRQLFAAPNFAKASTRSSIPP